VNQVALDHCVIHVSDWTRSNDFYARVLGAEVVPVGEGFAYRFGNAQLNIHGPNVSGTPKAKLPVLPGGSDLCFTWSGGIHSALKHLEACGVEIEVGPVQRFGHGGQGSSVYFRDPDGSLLEFISYDEEPHA
jgi:catechol 2,3-dioxygenase-like lactoylglutathione lyase family enzyme